VVLVSSFLEVRGAVFQPELTLGNYQKAFALMGNALTNSLVFAGTALVIVTVLGAVLGYVLTRQKTVLSRCLDFFLMVPFIVPGTVLGIGFVQVFNTPPVLLTGTASIIVIIYVIRRLPYVSRSSASMVHQIDISLEDASASLGARPMGTFTKIMLPLMRPGIFAGMVLAWLEIFNELSASIVLYTGATKTLPIAAYQQAVGGDFGLAAAYSGLLIAVTSVSIGLSMLFGDIDPARQNVSAAA
jgi:iron(III) transport system permease protein